MIEADSHIFISEMQGNFIWENISVWAWKEQSNKASILVEFSQILYLYETCKSYSVHIHLNIL